MDPPRPRRYRLAPQSIGLELTESLIAEDTEKIIDSVNELKRMGLILAIDDLAPASRAWRT